MKMKKAWLGIILSAVVMVAASGCGEKKEQSAKEDAGQETVDKADSESTEKEEQADVQDDGEQALLDTASALVEDLVKGDYSKISEDYEFEATMKAAVESGQLEGAMKPAMEALGELKSTKTPWVGENTDQYTNIYVPCEFANQPCNMMISFTADGLIGGIFTKEYQEGKEEAKLPESVEEKELNLEIADNRTLPGTFAVPKNLHKYPAVVFVHGSGPNGRDETVGLNKPFRDLAWGLAKQGIASFRYDKVTYVYGEEVAADKEFTVYDETVNDAVKAAALLKKQEGVSKVYILGHSQGAMMMGAIAQGAEPDGCIMMAGPTGNFAEMMERQYQFIESLNTDATDEEKAYYEKAYAEIDKMKMLETLPEDTTVMGMSLPYLQSILGYDTVGEAQKINAPVLVLQGEEDYQVTMDDYKVWQDSFKDKENWHFTSFPGLTHLFMEGKYEEGPASYEVAQHIPDEVIDVIAGFIKDTE